MQGSNAPEDFQATTETQLPEHLKIIRDGMLRNKLLLEQERLARQEKRKYVPGDPKIWQAQLDALLEAGYTDLCIGYTRTSSLKQEEAFGPEMQRRSILGWANANTKRGVDLFVWDCASGREESRLGIDFLREAIKTGKIKYICAFRHDRFARNLFFAELLQREVKEAGTSLVSATESIPAGFLGTLTTQITQAISQYEVALMTDRFVRGRREARLAGVMLGGAPPYGYRKVGSGKLEVCEDEQRVVLMVVKLYSLGFAPGQVAAFLTASEIPGRQRAGCTWHGLTITHMLQNEAGYRAEALFGPNRNLIATVVHPPLLPHREDPSDRTYLFGNVKMLGRGYRVPADYLAEAPELKLRLRINSVQSLTPRQSQTLLVAFHWLDAGLSMREVAKRLNDFHLCTPHGHPFTASNLRRYIVQREKVEETAARVGVTNIFLPLSEGPEDQEQARIESEKHAIERIHALRGQGLTGIAIERVLEAEGVVTYNGGKWWSAGINKVLNGVQRQSQTRVFGRPKKASVQPGQ